MGKDKNKQLTAEGQMARKPFLTSLMITQTQIKTKIYHFSLKKMLSVDENVA